MPIKDAARGRMRADPDAQLARAARLAFLALLALALLLCVSLVVGWFGFALSFVDAFGARAHEPADLCGPARPVVAELWLFLLAYFLALLMLSAAPLVLDPAQWDVPAEVLAKLA